MSTRVRVALVVGLVSFAAGAILLWAGRDTSSVSGEPFRYTVHLRGYADEALTNTCTGVLVAPDSVLTVKHCWGATDSFTAIVGIADRTEAEQDPEAFVYTGEIVERQGVGVDLAMVRLDRPVPSDVGSPIPLDRGGATAEGTPASISGWGERDGVRPTQLDTFDTMIDADCGQWDDPETETGFLEAGFNPDITVCTSAVPRGACTGDSGAPVVVDEDGTPRLVGIVAFGSGEGCGVDPLLPDAHVAIAPFADWIEGLSEGG